MHAADGTQATLPGWRCLCYRAAVAWIREFRPVLGGTATAELVAQLQCTGVSLADTRKTTPGLRLLENMQSAAAAASTTAWVSMMRRC